jgi:POT family proton-dependent oligopeptide transporter
MAQPKKPDDPRYSHKSDNPDHSAKEGRHLKWVESPIVLGHPAGLFTLFFAEMWERFSFYGMRALLVFYMTKSFLGYGDNDAYAIYGAYTALVYMTPFFGGLLADRLLGQRRSVVLGGILMAAGHLLMTVENRTAFFTALALLICGNGFFKPNISTIVGSLYPPQSPKRDGGFTIFYMGVNLGAAIAPLLCGYVGETYGWHWGFGLATFGMIVGVAIFVAWRWATQILIMVTALATAGALLLYRPENLFSIGINIFVAIALLISGVVATIALGRGGVPDEAGAPPNRERLTRPRVGPISLEWLVYGGSLAAVVLFSLLVSGFAPFTKDHKPVSLVSDTYVKQMEQSDNKLVKSMAVVVHESSRPAGLVLLLAGVLAFGYLIAETFTLEKISRQRMYVVLILTFFSMLFWSFFEQAGSSVNNFTDRNVNRFFQVGGFGKPEQIITAADVGKTVRLQPTQKQLGYYNGDKAFTMDVLDKLRDENKNHPDFEIDWKVTDQNIGMEIVKRNAEIPASTFQSINAICILIFGLIFTAMWGYMAVRRIEPGTTVKFALGLLQLGLGFGAFWLGAKLHDPRGMVGMSWLCLGYLLHTTGELCISPVGLSMVTKLSPAKLVSTVMGAWFLATAFSQFLAAIIAQFTDVSEGGESSTIPIPLNTVNIYGDIFGKIAIGAIISSAVCFVLAPLLNKWMHPEANGNEANLPAGH